MSDFIFEHEIGNIRYPLTREYLSEVLSSYSNGNYRASIVSLYSVVIFDLLHKVIQLKEIYNSEEAKEILETIENMQQASGGLSANWENELICRVTEHIKKTKNSVGNEHDPQKKYLALMDSFSYGKFIRLKNDRNKCAHPAHDENYLLRSFNKDETRAHIRNMFECIFLKDMVLGNDVCKMIEEDIVNLQGIFETSKVYDANDKEKVKKYFSHKYFKKLNDTGKKQVFKFLWDKTMSVQCEVEVIFNYFVLTSLIDENFQLLNKYFIEEIHFNKDIYTEENLNVVTYSEPSPFLITGSFAIISCFFAEYKSFYEALPEELKTKIKSISDKYINFNVLTYYQSNNMEDHLSKAKMIYQCRYTKKYEETKGSFGSEPKYDPKVLLKLYDISKNMNNSDVRSVRKYILEYSLRGFSYSFCNSVLEKLIVPLASEFEKDEFLELFKKMNKDSQFYSLGKGDYSSNQYPSIRHYMDRIKESSNKVLGEDFDYLQYENLR